MLSVKEKLNHVYTTLVFILLVLQQVAAQSKFSTTWPPIVRSIELDHGNTLYDFLSTLNYIKSSDGKELFYLSTMGSHSLSKFEVNHNNKAEIVNVIEMPKDGPDKLKYGISAFWVLSEDKIVVKGNDGDYVTINEAAEYLNMFRCEYLQEDGTTFPHPILISNTKTYPYNGKHITSTYGTPAYEFNYVGSMIDIDSSSCTPILPKTSYQKEWFGSENNSNLHSFAADNNYIYGAPATSHQILKVNQTNEVIDTIDFALSLLGEILPIPEEEKRSSVIRQQKHLANQGFYQELMYDKYQDKLYRKAYDKNPNFKKTVDAFNFPYLLVMNSEGVKTHELELVGKYDTSNMIETENGFCIMNMDKSNDLKFHFDCFKFD